MRRRQFVSTLATATAATTLGTASFSRDAVAVSGTIEDLVLDSSCSLLDYQYNELADGSVVSVWAEGTTENVDADGNGDATTYGENSQIPVVATDWNTVGFGGIFVNDSVNWQYGNEEFVLNVWDDALGGSGTVLWDEGHGQYYDLASASEFEDYAESNGYTVTATQNLSADLASADAVVITAPGTAFTQQELSDLGSFVSGGGWVFLHNESDYSNFDETQNLNDIAGYLELAYRFNDDQLQDDIVNAGENYKPVTDEFNDATFPYFDDRAGLGLDPTATYTVDVTAVTDGDTVDVQFDDGTTESIRILGIDTPETSANSQYERVQEWEGIEDSSYLETWGANATDYATAELSNQTVDLHFDANEPVRDAFGRVLGYITYDAGSGTRDTLYNEQAVADGYARVYDSGFANHDSFITAETNARDGATGVWGQSDPNNSTEIRNRDVDDLFFPTTASVRTTSGAVDPARVPVFAESSASQDLDGGHDYSGDIPLVAVDETNSVAVVGGPFVDEGYELDEGYAVDTSNYENFVFLTNLIDYLGTNSGDVLVDGGHGQFGTTFGLSAEDTAYYMRFLEGQDIGLAGVNDITDANLSEARALVVTTPERSFTSAEVSALDTFVADGGAVILMGDGKVTADARANLNALAGDLGTDLRLNEDLVTDGTNNVDSDAEVPETTNFDTSFPLFAAYGSGGSSGGQIDVAQVHEDAAGNDNDNLNDEYVVFENVGSGSLDLTGWTVEDEVGKTYAFPSGFSLAAGATVTLHTGSGTDTSSDLYWGKTQAVWNNSGDTVFVYDDAGSLAEQHSY
ncbi:MULTISPECIES: DUF4350 domain-containing protein [unclassified Haladaptatus]|uniref:DUF4350 domain-containing protein n=1 Tax=unclassified Haladaptatus TaxID=2622732 RepID=UPI0023E8DF74|nr:MULTISPECIES: DUF4350 domain-containing protein [unclassified Haladaptatus]